jgi:RNA ligase
MGTIGVVFMSEIEFQGFGKVARLFRDVVITEKIDGTNGAIGIVPMADFSDSPPATPVSPGDGIIYAVYAQSRKRLIDLKSDNFGFARWVWANAETLVRDLGPGLHFGEWWGSGIQRGYGLPKGDKRFSLFNVKRWTEAYPISRAGDEVCYLPKSFKTPNLGVVPVLYRGPFSTTAVNVTLLDLNTFGSQVVQGFDRPEGIIVYHTAANELFKVTVENDEKPKGLVA